MNGRRQTKQEQAGSIACRHPMSAATSTTHESPRLPYVCEVPSRKTG